MTAPLSEEYLAEVEAAIPLGYDGPWDFVPAEEGGNWLVGYNTDNPDAGLVATVPDYGFYLADFIARARTDVPALVAEVRRLWAVMAAAQTGHAPAARTVPAGVRELVGDLNARSGFAESCWVVPAPKRWALLFPREDGPLYFTVSRQHKTINEAVRLGLVRLSGSLMPLPAHEQVPTWLSRTVSQPLEGYKISALGGAK